MFAPFKVHLHCYCYRLTGEYIALEGWGDLAEPYRLLEDLSLLLRLLGRLLWENNKENCVFTLKYLEQIQQLQKTLDKEAGSSATE